ncbi:MAG: hypothetical protein ACREUG_12895, partial [Steroidobacteraceae bacterium]
MMCQRGGTRRDRRDGAVLRADRTGRRGGFATVVRGLIRAGAYMCLGAGVPLVLAGAAPSSPGAAPAA